MAYGAATEVAHGAGSPGSSDAALRLPRITTGERRLMSAPPLSGRVSCSHLLRAQVGRAQARTAEAGGHPGGTVQGEGGDDVGAAVDRHVEQEVAASAGTGELAAGIRRRVTIVVERTPLRS